MTAADIAGEQHMRYFFDLSDGSQARDLTGTDFPDPLAAQRDAIRYAGEVLKHEPERLEHGSMCVVVRDEAGSVLFTVDIRLNGASSIAAD